MPVTILATKLYIPPPPPQAVLRTHLLERLSGGLHRKLTIIAAPVGCGKTTLLSAWVAACGRPVAWLSLDAGDSDLTRFLTYIVSALRTVAQDIGEGVLTVLQSFSTQQSAPYEAVLTNLLNEITTIPQSFVLVLDDYHLVDAQAVDDALAFLVERLPPQIHLVIASREDPPLPLARLRARDQLTELRASDLRFSSTEAAGFLQAMNLKLSTEDVAALEARTEGWIAGLQLAALSLQGRPDVSRFIQTFAGDHRYIADYLVEEVLQRQPAEVRSFLLQTSILERLHGPLCDAVTRQGGGRARLASLERGNFFMVPLDDKRQWYRYHHLFADVLHAHLVAEAAEEPHLVATLHRRASEWYEQNGSAPDAMLQAVRHALAASDFERAANLIELAFPTIFRLRQEAVVLGWLKALPDDVVRWRPVLSAEYAQALLATGELKGVEGRLRDAERWLDTPDTLKATNAATAKSEMVVVDEEEFRALPGTVSLTRAAQFLALGDLPSTLTYARRVLNLVPEEDHLRRGGAAAVVGLASWAMGDLEVAHRTYAEGMAHLQLVGNIPDAIAGAIPLADIRIAQGRLHEAMRTYEQALQLAPQASAAGSPQPEPAAGPSAVGGQREHGAKVLRGTADMYVGISTLHRERNELDLAMQYLVRSKELGEPFGFPQYPYRWRVAMSRVLEAQGNLDGALDLLSEAERVYMSDFSPNVRPIPAMKARVWIRQGRLGEALDWASARGLSPDDELSYLREFEHMTLARLLLVRCRDEGRNTARTHSGTDHSLREAMGLLERLLKAAEEGGRTGSVIEILVLKALAHHAQGDIPAALVPLARALTLADPEGYVRIFVDEGTPMRILLEEAAKRREDGIAPSYVRRLLSAFGETSKAEESQDRTQITQALTEPLSIRELEVLRLLRTELSGPEIARELTVSLHTIRTHTNNIYIKLGVNNRRAAVRRAEELNLI